MIFCFSGTGNSLHVAEKLAQKTNDRIIMMTEMQLTFQKEYQLEEKEYLGFVFPIYWCGIPVEVEKFLTNIKLMYSDLTYTYAVCTYGLAGNNGLNDLQKNLKNKGIYLDASFEVKMVDNYIVGYELANIEKQKAILQNAEIQIEKIINDICNERRCKTKDYFQLIKPLVHGFYQNTNHRKGFRVNDNCIGCNKCQQECPSGVIQIIDGKPKWKDNCSFCLKCIHSCPVQAIQYKHTEGRKRYLYQKSIE